MWRYYLQPAGLLMDRIRIRQTWIRWLPWELHPQRPRKQGEREREGEGGGWGEVVCEVKNKRGRGEEQQQWGGWLMEKEEMEKEGWRERGEERSPLLSVWNIWFSRKGDLGEEDKGSLAFCLSVFLITSLYHPLSSSLSLTLLNDVGVISRYNRKCTLTHLFNNILVLKYSLISAAKLLNNR